MKREKSEKSTDLDSLPSVELSSVKEFVAEKMDESFRGGIPVEGVDKMRPIILYPFGLLIYGGLLATFIVFFYQGMPAYANE